MPGDAYDGTDPDGAMTSHQFVELLEDYARRHELPVQTTAPVTELAVDDGIYRLRLPHEEVLARNVVIATSNQNCPVRPPFSAWLPRWVQQIDASQYRNASSLDSGAVLVVGSAQSGGQIAKDLVDAGRTVFLATGRVGRLPRSYRGNHVMIWLVRSGRMDVTRSEMLQHGPIPGRPLAGALHTISLQSLSAQGVVLLGRLTGVADGRLSFGDDVEENIRYADETSVEARRHIDEYIARAGIVAPEAEPDASEVIDARLPDPPIRTIDLAAGKINTVIWCTGFRGDFRWIRIAGLLDAQGQPVHESGFADVPGVYFAGLPFAISRRSGTILAVTEEASRFSEHIWRRSSRSH